MQMLQGIEGRTMNSGYLSLKETGRVIGEEKEYIHEGDLHFRESLTVEVPLVISGTLTVEGSFTGYKSLSVGSIKCDDNFELSGDLYVSGSSLIGGNCVIKGHDVVEGNECIGGSQRVSGYQVINGDQDIGGNQRVLGYKDVAGHQSVAGEMYVYNTRTNFSMTMKLGELIVRLTAKFIHVGNRIHDAERWQDFTDKEIEEMGNTLEDWKMWKDFIIATHANLVTTYNNVSETKGK